MSQNLYWEETFPVINLFGDGCRQFLQGQTTANILSKKEDQPFLSFWLTQTGKILSLLEIKLQAKGASVIIISGEKDQVINGFNSVIFPSDRVSIKEGNMIKRLQLISNNYQKYLDNKVVWQAIDSNDIIPFPSSGKASESEVTIWRINNGFPISPLEINGKNNPFELGLSKLISAEKGCYLGQESIARFSRSGDPRRVLIKWESEDDISQCEEIFCCNDEHGTIKVGAITSYVKLVNQEGSQGFAIVNRKLVKNTFQLNNSLKCGKLTHLSELSDEFLY